MTPTAGLAGLVRDSDALAPDLVPAARAGPGVCSACRTWSDTESDTCSSCAIVAAVLGSSAMPVCVATLYSKPSPVRDALTGYKDGGPDGLAAPSPDAWATVRALTGRFLLEHGTAIAQGRVDGIVVVPSTTRCPPHPLAAVLASLGLDVPVLPWLVRTASPLGHNAPHPDAFAAADGLRPGARVVVADDVYTTGARANSAVHALRRADVRVAALAAVARRVNPDLNAASRAFWDRQAAVPYTWSGSPVLA